MITFFTFDGVIEVWSDPQGGSPQTGRCIGVAVSRLLALEDAERELRKDLTSVTKELKAERVRLKSCAVPCSPSDFQKGGKCDKHGCIKKGKPAKFVEEINSRLERRGLPVLTKAQERVIKERVSRLLLLARAVGLMARDERAGQ